MITVPRPIPNVRLKDQTFISGKWYRIVERVRQNGRFVGFIIHVPMRSPGYAPGYRDELRYHKAE